MLGDTCGKNSYVDRRVKAVSISSLLTKPQPNNCVKTNINTYKCVLSSLLTRPPDKTNLQVNYTRFCLDSCTSNTILKTFKTRSGYREIQIQNFEFNTMKLFVVLCVCEAVVAGGVLDLTVDGKFPFFIYFDV